MDSGRDLSSINRTSGPGTLISALRVLITLMGNYTIKSSMPRVTEIFFVDQRYQHLNPNKGRRNNNLHINYR